MVSSVKIEVIALLINILLIIFHYDKQNKDHVRYRLFSLCLYTSAISICFDIITCFTIEYIDKVPYFLNMLVNSFYFAIMDITFSLIAIYCFYVLFEHVSSKKCLHYSVQVVSVLCLTLVIILFVNVQTGILFSIENGQYIRGDYNKIGHVFLLFELVLLCICYLRNKKVESQSVHRLMKLLPVIVILLAGVQILIPDILLNGTLSTVVCFVLFISFQNNRLGQDDLTEVYNRHQFFRDFEKINRKKRNIHFILIHLEEFETVNKKFGIQKGDDLLYTIARYLESFDSHYFVYRFGNTHFLLLGEDITKHQAMNNAQMIYQRFMDPWTFSQVEYILNISLGHMYQENFEEENIMLIDKLEYTLSCAGEAKNSILFYDQHLKDKYERNNEIIACIKKAIEEESFEIYYQPVYDCHSHNYHTAESLLRLFDEHGEMISPTEFIPVAEKNGLLDDITWIVIKKVCQFLGENKNLPIKSISINVSMQQLTDKTLLQRIRSSLYQYDIAPEQLKIEITERVIAKNIRQVSWVMNQFIQEGIQFYLDDFGIGYSNLASVLSLPFETVKLDKTLIDDIVQNHHTYEAIKYIVNMLHFSGFQIVVEGLETKEIVDKMIELPVDKIQGYYFAKPMNEKDTKQFYQSHE